MRKFFPLLGRTVLLACLSLSPTGASLAAPGYWLADAAGIVLAKDANPIAVSNWATKESAREATELWNGEAQQLIIKYRMNPLRAARMLSYLHTTMHDAAARAEELKLRSSARSAATHAAGAAMLGHFFPLESPARLEALGESFLAALAASHPGLSKEIASGASLGKEIARLSILRALEDGADEVWDLTSKPAMHPGMWHGAPPLDSAHPQEALAGTWRPWVLKSGGEIQPPPPPAIDSGAFTQGAREVLEVNRSLTPKQKQIAEDWHLDQGTVTPPGVWNRKALELAKRRNMSEQARLGMLAALNAAMLDASIACWQAKFTWWVQRPVTTIRENLDQNFMPHLVTPPHPSYVSGHATVSGAAAQILKHYFPKDAGQIDAWALEAAMSRLYGGIHYRFDNDAGLELGKRIGKAVIARAKILL